MPLCKQSSPPPDRSIPDASKVFDNFGIDWKVLETIEGTLHKLCYPNAINLEHSYGGDKFVRAALLTFGAEASMKF